MIEAIAYICVLMLAIAWIPQIWQGYKIKRQEINKWTQIIYIICGLYLGIYNVIYWSPVNVFLNFSILFCVLIVTFQYLKYKGKMV